MTAREDEIIRDCLFRDYDWLSPEAAMEIATTAIKVAFREKMLDDEAMFKIKSVIEGYAEEYAETDHD